MINVNKINQEEIQAHYIIWIFYHLKTRKFVTIFLLSFVLFHATTDGRIRQWLYILGILERPVILLLFISNYCLENINCSEI